MNYGMQLSASGLLTSLYRMDVLSSNLANVGTPGFKADLPITRQRDPARLEDGLGLAPSNRLLERLGAGVLMDPNRLDLAQGPVQSTGNPLDLAIHGEGFFLVREGQGGGDSRDLLTRDGRFTLDAEGYLVTAAGGRFVLDASSRPIRVEGEGPLRVGPDGAIRRGDEEIARLQLVALADPTTLRKAGPGTFAAPDDAMASRRPATGRITQGEIEGSGVDPIVEMMRLSAASRDAEANYGMLERHDRVLDRAINVLGRVA